MKLYGRGQSRSFRCVWAFFEAEVPFEYINVAGSNLPDNYSTLNTQIKVPTLVDGDLVLNESAAIVNYAGRLSKQMLIPDEPRARASYDDMCYFVMTEFEQPLWSIGKHRFAIPEEYRIEDMFKTATWEFQKAQAALLQKFDGIGFVLGDDFSMADVLLAQTLNWAVRFEMDVDDGLKSYRDRLFERPACVTALNII
jgi:glutathione S-transferase